MFLFVSLPVLIISFRPSQLLAATDNNLDAVSAKQTMAICQQASRMDAGQIQESSAMVGRMNYNAQRIFRKVCSAPGADYNLIRQAGERLLQSRMSYEQVRSYDALSSMPNFNAHYTLPALDAISTLTFASGRTFRNFTSLYGATADQALEIIPQLNQASPLVNQAARAYFGVSGMRVDTAMQGLPIIVQMRSKQAQALIAFAETPGMDPQTMVQGMDIIRKMGDVNVWNARSLFKNKETSGQEALSWLKNYFTLSTSQQEVIYDRLQGRQKSVLLKGLYDGGEEAIWKINNLHAVTDENGYEYPAARVNRMSKAELQGLFNKLDGTTRSRFGAQFSAAGQGQAVGILQQATSAARVQAAKDLTTANMYVVLAQGSELYDSSFRNIVVPVMKSRIAQRNGGDLLNFLREIDPESRFVSDFISSNAQKGKLTEFFPRDFARQKEILNLVGSSAFKDADSVLLFSATFSHLLKMLTPEARSHLIALMAQQTQSGNQITAKLVRVILQYYVQTYPELLGSNDRLLISRLLVQQGAVNLDRYQTTPFAEWKKDGKMASLSMYHPDDDGRQSFASNASLLMKNGYQLVPSKYYTISQMTPALESSIRAWARGSIGELFQAMRTRHFAVSFVKNVNGVNIVNTQFVYSGKEHQKELLRRFILSGDEMLAQRGHSYWRSEQIIEPLTELIDEGKITTADLANKQRFLSLGSCGGVKVYTTLTRLFEGSVDLLASIGTGLAMINDPYNKSFCEIIAKNPSSISWKQVAQQTSYIFSGEQGQDYLQPGSLTAILHKILDESGPQGQSHNPAAAQNRNNQAPTYEARQEQGGRPVYYSN